MGWCTQLSHTGRWMDDPSCEAGHGMGDGPGPTLRGSKPKTERASPSCEPRSSPNWGSWTYCSVPAFDGSSSRQVRLSPPSSPPDPSPVQIPPISRSLWLQGAPLVFSSISVQFSHSVMSNSLRPRGPQHARPPCPAPAPGVYSNSCPLSR